MVLFIEFLLFLYVQQSDGKPNYDIKQTTNYLDISASLVRSYIPRDAPVLRVLFHGATDAGVYLQRRKICILLHIALDAHKTLRGRCMPDGDDNVCVAEVVIPANWWPKLSPPDKDGRTNTVKQPQPMVQVSYSVFEPPAKNPEQCEPKVQIQPATVFAQVKYNTFKLIIILLISILFNSITHHSNDGRDS